MTNEQLAALRHAANGGVWKIHLTANDLQEIVTHIDAQAARIAELEAKVGAGNEWRWAHDDVLVSLYEARKRIMELEQRVAELEASAVNQQLTTEATGKDCLHVGVPDGWQLVPVELTQEMSDAWDCAPNGEDDGENMRAGYRAMLAATQKPEGQS